MAKKTKEQIAADATRTQRTELVLSTTQGSGGIIKDEEGKTFAQVYQSEDVDGDANRLALCWNAFIGVPTNQIDSTKIASGV